MREGPDGGLNGDKKALKWKSSEKVGNVLEAKTPEEEYVANCETEIIEIMEKVKKNEKALKEVEKQLPSHDKEKEMMENFSIKKLSEFLSEDELNIVKKWREYNELIQAIKGSDKYSSLIEKIYGWIKNFSDEEKLIIAEYLWSKQIILIDMHQYDAKRWHSITVGFYYTDFANEMDKVHEIQINLRKLWLEEYVGFVWDSCYRIDNNFYASAREKVKKENASDMENWYQEKFNKLTKERENLERKLEKIEERKSAVEKYGLPEKDAISLYQWREKLEWIHDEVYDKENNVCVVLHEYSDYSGSGGSEYGTVISIKRGKNTTKKSFKYRDRYDYRNDIPGHEYRKIESIKVGWDKVEVTVSSGKFTDTYEFNIAYQEPKKIIDRKEFEESIKKIEKQLIEENTKDLRYLASHDFELRKTPWAFSAPFWADLETELPYKKAEVIYENLDPENWVAHITIKKHNDASWAQGLEFSLVKYVVTPKWAKKLDEYSYWQYALDTESVKKKIVEFSRW